MTADTPLDARLLNDFQQNFPLCSAPFAELASRLGVAESAVLGMLDKLRREGRIARVGAVFAAKRIGSSTLAAISVPAEKLAAVSEAVNRFPEVNHNDVRDHLYNLWFVVTAGSEGRLQAALRAIERAAGLPILCMPFVKLLSPESRVFDSNETRGTGNPDAFKPPTALDEIERRLLVALQEGLPFFIRPFSVLASRVGCDESEVLERIRKWCAEGIIKRFGLVVRNRLAAVDVRAMLVLDIPDEEIAAIGEKLARDPGIPLCYQRQRTLPDWPYNLFFVIHGQTRDGVRESIKELLQRLDLASYAHDVLFSADRH